MAGVASCRSISFEKRANVRLESAIRQQVTLALFGWCLTAMVLGACGGAGARDAGRPGDGDAETVPSLDGPGDDGANATDGQGGAFMPAPHPPLPQVLNSGGPVIAAPKVLPILYAGDTGASDIEAFLKELTETTFWSQTTSEYGVGAFTVLPTVMMSGAAPKTVSDANLQATLAGNTSGSDPLWGASDPSTIYLFVLPAGTIQSDAQGACCNEYAGYHSETTGGSVALPYVVACACSGFGGPDDALNERTIAISHELVESATDPFPNTNPAFFLEDDDDIVWKAVTGGEIADMCVLNEDAFFIPPGSKYMIQRTWSNAAARASRDPCVPNRTTAPYFNTFPALDTITYNPGGGGELTTKGINIPIGATRTIPLTPFSAAPKGGTWTVRVYDSGYLNGGTANLLLVLDRSQVQNGDTLNLTITPQTADPRLEAEAFVIFSEYGTPGTDTFQSSTMMGLVTN